MGPVAREAGQYSTGTQRKAWVAGERMSSVRVKGSQAGVQLGLGVGGVT